jgi:hypothetical protein
MQRSGRWTRILLTILALTAVMGLALPALAQEEATTTTAPAGATTAPVEDIEPAVPIVPAEETPTLADWTYRYLIPTGLALAVLVIVITSIRYFTNVVRKRYRIVE